MKHKLKVNHKNYFKIILRLLKPFKPFNTLCNREAQLLSELLNYNYEYRTIPFEARMKLIFNQDTRAELTKSLNMSKATLYNNFNELRKKGFITLNSINKNYLFNPDEDLHKELVFQFIIDEKDN